jgi:DNA-binding LacI/PurR family transcriptional regulator
MVQSLPERPTDFPASGRVGMRALLRRRRPPDAVIAYNDLMAIGALAECHEQGLRVPADVAVYGFGDEEISAHLCPALSTVRIREDRLAGDTVDQLFDRLASPRKNPDRQVLLKSIFEWCPRASTP